MKKLCSFLFVIAMVLTLAACGQIEESAETPPPLPDYEVNEATLEVWPANEWTGQINMPPGNVGEIKIGGEMGEMLSIKMDWTREEAINYAKVSQGGRYFRNNVTTNYDDKNATWLFIGTNGIDFQLAVSINEILVTKPY